MFTPNSVKNDITFANRFICFNLCRDMIVINIWQRSAYSVGLLFVI